MLSKIRALIPQRGSIQGDAFRIFVLQMLTMAFVLANNVAIARTLGPTNKGVVDLFTLLNSFMVSFGLFSLGTGLLYYLANKGQSLQEIHGTGLLFVLVAGGLTAALGLIALPLWKSIFPGLPRWMILLAFGLAPFAYYRDTWAYLALGINWAVTAYWINFIFTVITLLSTGALWLIDQLNRAQVIHIGAVLLVAQSVVSFALLYRRAPRLAVNLSLARQSLRYSLIAHAGVLTNLLHFRIDQLLVSRWLGTKDLGIYAISVRFAEMLLLLETPISAATLHRVSSSSAEDSYRLTKRLFRLQFLISAGAGLMLALISYPLIVILYGHPYKGAILPLLLLIPGVVAWSSARTLSQYISYNRGKNWIPTVLSVTGAVVNIGLNAFLIMHWGIIGAAISSTVSYSLVNLMTLACFRLYTLPKPAVVVQEGEL